MTNENPASTTASTIPRPIAIDARAKIIWGEPPEKILAYLESKGASHEDALALVAESVEERVSDIRRDGIKLFVTGVLGMAVPVAFITASIATKITGVKFLAVTLVIGAIGAWRATKGYPMMTRPGSIKGSQANRED